MLGLLQLIKATTSAVNLAAVGIDLESLGLALDSSEPVTRDWEIPWTFFSSNASNASSSSTAQSQDSRVPSCYILPPSIILNPATKLTYFSDETLLYIFYAMPRERLQELAARELTARSWRYHKELQQWLTVETEIPGHARYPLSNRTFTLYFDVLSWSRCRRETFIDKDDVIEDRFLKR